MLLGKHWVIAALMTSAALAATTEGAASGSRSAFLDDKRVPQLGLGLAALGRPGYINIGRDAELGTERSPEAMERRAHEVLDAAFGAGVRYFDCARSYGESERFLSSWLSSRGVGEDVLVGSKWGYRYTAGWLVDNGALPHEVKDHSLAHLRSQTGETVAHLGPQLRLYQIHSATLESGVLDDVGVLAELRRLKVIASCCRLPAPIVCLLPLLTALRSYGLLPSALTASALALRVPSVPG
jgi:hypothetical protein